MTVTIRVDNRIHVPLASGAEDVVRELIELHTYPNPDYAAAAARSKWGPPKKIPKELCTWWSDGSAGTVSFPRGSLDRVLQMFDAYHVAYNLDIDRCDGAPELQAILNSSPLSTNIDFRGFQDEQIAAGLQHPTCVWRAPPGSGKTTSTNGYLAALNKPAIVVVPSAKVFEQWVRRIQAELGLSYEDIGMLGDGYKRIRPLTVAMQQTLIRTGDQYSRTFGVYAADEVQRHGSATFSAVSDLSQAYHRLGVSADERRADCKEFLIYDLFGPVRHEVARSKLIADGYIHDAEIRIIPTSVSLPWYDNIPPQKRASGRIQSRLHEELATNEERNDLIRSVLKWCMDAGEQTLMLATRLEHCHRLNAIAATLGHKCGLMLGGSDQKEDFERAREAMEDGSLRIAAGTYQAIGVGFDLPALSRGIMAAPCANTPKGKYQFGQYTGRFERISGGKTGAIIYYIWDPLIFGDRALNNLLKWRTRVRVLHGGRWVSGKEYKTLSSLRNLTLADL